MRPSVEESFEQIDAAFFSGDDFYTPDNFAEVKKYLDRWNRQMYEISKVIFDGDGNAFVSTEVAAISFLTEKGWGSVADFEELTGVELSDIIGVWFTIVHNRVYIKKS